MAAEEEVVASAAVAGPAWVAVGSEAEAPAWEGADLAAAVVGLEAGPEWAAVDSAAVPAAADQTSVARAEAGPELAVISAADRG